MATPKALTPVAAVLNTAIDVSVVPILPENTGFVLNTSDPIPVSSEMIPLN